MGMANQLVKVFLDFAAVERDQVAIDQFEFSAPLAVEPGDFALILFNVFFINLQNGYEVGAAADPQTRSVWMLVAEVDAKRRFHTEEN